MTKKRFFYLKANRQKWKDELNKKNNNLDWALVKNNKEYKDGILFSAKNRKRDYFEQIMPGDIVVLHSTHISSSKKKADEGQNFVPRPRIIGLSKISEGLHYDERYKDDKICIDVENMAIFGKPLEIKELNLPSNKILKEAEPFRKGTNRCPLTELKANEYQELKKLILSKNPD